MDILAACSVESVQRAKSYETILWLNFCGSCWNVQGVLCRQKYGFLKSRFRFFVNFASVGFGVTLQSGERTNGHMTKLRHNHQVQGLRVSYFTLIVLLVGGRLLFCCSFPIFSWHCLRPCGILVFILSTEKSALCVCVREERSQSNIGGHIVYSLENCLLGFTRSRSPEEKWRTSI